jgi:phosphocarrier protein HPr
MIERPVQIVNEKGLHARAAAKFVAVASGFRSEIHLANGYQQVNGKSIMGMLMLAATQGTVLTLKAHGSDQEEALSALERLIADRFGEGA